MSTTCKDTKDTATSCLIRHTYQVRTTLPPEYWNAPGLDQKLRRLEWRMVGNSRANGITTFTWQKDFRGQARIEPQPVQPVVVQPKDADVLSEDFTSDM